MEKLLAKFIKSKQFLDESEAVFLESSIVSITDERGTILYANDKFCEVSGYSREELIGQNHRIVKSRFHDEAFFKELYQTLLSGNDWTGEICNRTKSGDLYWVQTLINPIWDEEKKKYFFISTRNDITNRKTF